MSRWLVAGSILLVEYLLVSLNFDSLPLTKRGGSWAIIGNLGSLAPLGVVVVASIVLLRARLQRHTVRASSVATVPPPIGWAPLLGHVALGLAFYAATLRLFADEAPPAGSPWTWLALWAALGAAMSLALLVGLVGRRAIAIQWGAAAWLLTCAGALGAAAWLAGAFSQSFWHPLSRATLGVVTALLRPFVAIDSKPEQLSLGLNGFEVTISSVCSGFEGIGLITVLMSAYLLAYRRNLRFPNALVLLPISVAAVWFGNAVRIAALMLLGGYVDAELAHGAFHSKAGWVIFCTIALGIAAIARRSRFVTRSVDRADETENPTAAYLLPFLTLLATALFTGMFANNVDLAYPLRIVAAAVALYGFRSYFRGLARRVSLLSVAVGALVGLAWLISTTAVAPKAAPYDAFRELPAWLFALWLSFRIAGSVIVVPICEELAFRGYLLRAIVSRDFTSVSFERWTPLALVGSSLAFGLVHERWLAGALAGAAYALVQIRTGRVGDAIVAHGVSNAIVAGFTVFSGDWSHWL
jgi:exosortase E/protease (VPEID-CTERM system)